MKIKKEHLILSFIFLIGMVIRILLFRNETFIGIDAAALTRLGKNLIEYGKYSFGENYNWGLFFPPGYPLSIGLMNLFINDLYISGKLISLFSSILTILLLYLIGKELHSKESGLFIAFIFSIHTAMLWTSVSAATESYFICWFFLSIYLFIITLRKTNFFVYLLLGVSIGMAYLTRPEGVFLLILPLLSGDKQSLFKDKKLLLNIGTTLLVFILIASPYLVFLKNFTGRYTLSGKRGYLSVILQEGVSSEEIEYDIAAYSLDEGKTHLNAFNPYKHLSSVNYIFNNPLTFIQKYLKNLKKAVKAQIRLLLPVLLPLLLLLFKKELFREKKFWVLILLAFLFFVIYPPFLILTRHMFITALLLMMISSVGFAQSKTVLYNLFKSSNIRENFFFNFFHEKSKYIIVILSILGVILNTFPSHLLAEKDIPIEHMKAGYFIRNNISSEYEKLNIMHRTPWVSFYSDARFTMMPYANYTDVINFAKLYKVDYIVVDERSSLREWKFYDKLINMDKYTDDIRLIYEDNSGKLIKIFEVMYK